LDSLNLLCVIVLNRLKSDQGRNVVYGSLGREDGCRCDRNT